MPRIDTDAYIPRPGEPAMMSADQRAAACLAHYKELAEAGDGRLITFGDGSAWFVPNDLPALARDFEAVLTGKTGGLAGFVIGEAFRVLIDIAKAEMKGAPAASVAELEKAAAAPVSAADAPLSKLEAMMATIGDTMATQTVLLKSLASRPEPAPAPAPTPQITAVSETILARLEDAGYQEVDHNKPGVVRGAMAFVNLYNGAQIAPVIPLATPQQCIEATLEGIRRYAEEAGGKRLVWRQYPTLGAQDGGYVIRCRLLAMEAAT